MLRSFASQAFRIVCRFRLCLAANRRNIDDGVRSLLGLYGLEKDCKLFICSLFGGDRGDRSGASFACFANLPHCMSVAALPCGKPPQHRQWGSIPSDHLWIQIKTADNLSTAFILGGAGVIKDEHPSVSVFSPSKASSISSSGIFSMLKGFLLALIIKVKWSSYK